MDQEKNFFTVNEFADKIRVHPNTIRRAIQKGRIQAFRTGQGIKSSYRIPNTEVQRLCELDMSKLIDSIVDQKIEKFSEFMENSRKIIIDNRNEKSQCNG